MKRVGGEPDVPHDHCPQNEDASDAAGYREAFIELVVPFAGGVVAGAMFMMIIWLMGVFK